MEEEFQLITTLFKWRTGQCWKLQAPLTVLTSCTILVCQWTSQPTTVQDTVTPFHLYYSMIKVRVYPSITNFSKYYLDNMEKNTSDETDFMEKNMTRVTPTSKLDNGITTWLLAILTVSGVIILTILLIFLLLVIACFIKHSKLLFSYSIN